ncbi:MAG TPA: tetratricopeptide repeat protein [Bryobacteraceae bacterium]|nr:tetratricopeptide repeat protein [Bryobacteraceae bacterium]
MQDIVINSWKKMRMDAMLAALLVAATVLTFWPVLSCEFVNYDDPNYVNEHVRQGLTAKGFGWAWTTTHMAAWHPLTWLSLMLDSQWMLSCFHALRASGFHATNLILHVANAVLCYFLFKRMTDSPWRSFLVAALFSLHPLRVESVAWITERKDVLSGFFGFLALHAYVSFTARPGSLRSALVAFWMALSLLAKPMLVTLPLLLLLLDYWPLSRFGRLSAARLLAEKIPLFALAGAASLVAWLSQRYGQPDAPPVFSSAARFANAIVSYAQYLRQTFYPVHLSVFYPFPKNGPTVWELGISVACLAALSGVVIWQRRRQPALFVGILWYFLALAPVAGFVAPDGSGILARADRYTYFPLIGFYVALSWGVFEFAGRYRHRQVLAPLAGAALVLLACLSWHQTRYWHDSYTLWSHALETTHDNWVAYTNRGDWLYQQGRYEEAERDLQEGLRLWPQAFPGNPLLFTRMGFLLLRRHNLAEAKVHFEKAIALRPAYPEAHNNLGHIYVQEHRYEEAIEEFRAALRFRPNSVLSAIISQSVLID